MNRHNVYLGLGTNMGNRMQQLERAISFLDEMDGIEVVKLSSIYETEPVGYLDQPRFLNMVIKVKTSDTAPTLLTKVLHIEKKMDRVRTIRWGPRTIDIDILLYDDETYNLPQLQIPHPRMWQRAFVLVPLLEIVDQEVDHRWGIAKKLEQLSDKNDVKRLLSPPF